MNEYKIAATAAFGVESVTKRELAKLGVDAKSINGRFPFEGNLELMAKCNMFLRTADRVYLVLGEFSATTFDELFESLESVPFEEFLSPKGKITVRAKSVKSTLFAVSAISSISKKAIVTRLTNKFKLNSLSESEEEYKIEISIFEDVVSVLLDTSGVGLHKRGYRTLAHEAPLKETLAAAIIQLSVYNPEKTLIDPFCGSGTIPLEAAMYAKDVAPGILRDFAFEKFKFFDSKIIDAIRNVANEQIKRDLKLSISGFDIDENSISLSMYHAKKLNLENDIHFQRMDMREVKTKARYGVIITNPPYGERLMTQKEVRTLYRDFGYMFRDLNDFSAYVITAYPEFERAANLKSDKDRKLFNGNMECRLYSIMGAKPPKANK